MNKLDSAVRCEKRHSVHHEEYSKCANQLFKKYHFSAFHTAKIKIHCKGEKTGRGKPKLELATVTPAQILVSKTIKPLMAAFRHERHPGCPFKNRYEGVH